jgi:hypothetical protein
VPFDRDVAQHGADLAILDLASRATVLPLDTDRTITFLDKAGLVDHTYPARIAENLDAVLEQHVAGGIGIPPRTVQQTLHRIRDAFTQRFSHLPAILARHLRHQPAQVLRCLCTWLLATKYIPKPGAEAYKIYAPFVHFFVYHRPSDALLLSPLSTGRPIL